MSTDATPADQRARRRFLGATLAGMAGGTLAGLEIAPASAVEPSDEKRIVGLHPAGAPAADAGYSPGISAAGQRLVFVSGQGPQDLQADMETQMRQTFERIGRVLEQAGASLKDIVMIRSYFVHIQRDLPVLRKVRRDYLVQPYPASTAVGVTALAIENLEIEIEALAVI